VSGILNLDARPLKSLLSPIPATCSEEIKQYLHHLFKEVSDSSIKAFKDHATEMQNLPHNLKEYCEFVLLLGSMDAEHSRLMADVNSLDDIKILCDEQATRLSMEEQIQLSSVHDVHFIFQQTLVKSKEVQEQQRNRMVGALHKEAQKLEQDTVQTTNDLGSGILVDETALAGDVLQRLDIVQHTVDGYKERKDTLEHYREVIKIDEIAYPNVERCVQRYEHRLGIWSLLNKFQNDSATWRGSNVADLDAETVATTTALITRELGMAEKREPEDRVARRLRELVDDFRPYVPLLSALCVKAMQPRHWKKLFSVMGKQYQPSLTLSQLLNMNILQYKSQIYEIASTANGEYGLESQLAKIKTSWKETAFELKKHKTGTYILGPFEEITEQLEDHQALLQTMLASRYVVGIREEIETWDNKLTYLQEMLDEWVKCQRGWMYLSAIFTQPDIVRQLPSEAEKFNLIDKCWRDIMTIAKEDSNCIKCLDFTVPPPGADPNVPPPENSKSLPIILTFQTCNKLLDEVQKKLEDYLETKRVKFPRFYFLSNDELLQILAQTADARAVLPFMSKCFDSINALKFVSEEEAIGMKPQPVPTSSSPVLAEGSSPTPAVEENTTPLPTTGGTEPNPSPSPQITGQPGKPDYVTTMISIENETVELVEFCSTKAPVEVWLLDFERIMRLSVQDQIRLTLNAYSQTPRTTWVFQFPAQAILAVDQIIWTMNVTNALESVASSVDPGAVQDFLEKCSKELSDSVNLVRGQLTALQRQTINTLIVVDVHARDIVASLVEEKTDSPDAFLWNRNLRYYWDWDRNDCMVKQTSTEFVYGYEYLGNSPRLVITPLTDRCYITLTLSLHLNLGGNPAGPAGTGKTETTKDLAKALARQCIVFNCSDQIDYKMMGRFFSGLVQAGAWACFDEFNRIEIEVLSVIAQQLLSILDAIRALVSSFEFEGNVIKINRNCGFFITMNPGYAGRTELPDNLKALFRPVAMMIPDYALISEIMLFSEGFQTARGLASKMTQLYKLSSEQLSQQDHYDFGMRAVKSVLVMAGALKRKYDTLSEDIVLIRALRDTNTPKFLSEDVPLFMNIVQDLFPGVKIPPVEHPYLQNALAHALVVQDFQPAHPFILKCLQLYETMEVRHGVMLVGQTGVGKSTCLKALSNALYDLNEHFTALNATLTTPENHAFWKCKPLTMNPKAVTMGELYGQFNDVTREWYDGLVPYYVKEMIERSKEEIARNQESTSITREVLHFDGPVDAIWIESMNSVLDDNKILCLSNGDRIKLTNNMTMLFEVADLRVASPATVSRCGMIYLEQLQVGWGQQALSWKQRFSAAFPHLESFATNVLDYFLEPVIKFVRKKEYQSAGQLAGSQGVSVTQFIESTTSGLVINLLNLFTSLAQTYATAHPSKIAKEKVDTVTVDTNVPKRAKKTKKKEKKKGDETDKGTLATGTTVGTGLGVVKVGASTGIPLGHYPYPPIPGAFLGTYVYAEDQYPPSLAVKHFIFCLIWTFGSSLDDSSRPKFDEWLLTLILFDSSMLKRPNSADNGENQGEDEEHVEVQGEGGEIPKKNKPKFQEYN
jgi:dynein heavy chain